MWKKLSIAALDQGPDTFESSQSREMATAIVTLLADAQEKVVLSSFLLADKGVEDAIFEAAKRGVRVYILIASEARLGREDGEGEFDKRVLAQHKAMLERLGGYALFRSASHFHAKVVIADPDTRPAGILLTANLTREALERNEELAVRLTSAEISGFVDILRWVMWECAEHELAEPSRFRAVKPLGILPHPDRAASVIATTSEVTSVRDEMLNTIKAARSRIVVSSFGWDEDHEVVRSLCVRAREGVDITVLARIRPSSMPALIKLAEAGAQVLGFKWLHAKAIWTDAGEALVMSANFQSDGLDHGFELGVRLRDGRAEEILTRLSRWRATSSWQLFAKPRLGDVVSVAKLWSGKQFDEIEVSPEKNIDLGNVIADSVEILDAPRPSLPKDSGLSLVHKLNCTWTVSAPLLAAKSKEQQRPGKDKEQPKGYFPPAFKEPKGRLVVAIKSSDELLEAKGVMAEIGASAIVLRDTSAGV
ncbi:phospholipase D-like domain-containing protein [Halopseudomonas sp.]|uniref:phospholipase D-like domain-containing protein n=1 Tax=Halopseudomonas sp. TaxID=2901191 RepID=UPI0039E56554